MKHHRTRALQYADIADAVKCINAASRKLLVIRQNAAGSTQGDKTPWANLEGVKVKRSTYKDGSIPTKSVVPVADLPEKQVVKDCIEWLRRYHIMCNRHDAASFQNDRGQWGVYGIKGAGDIIGMVGDYGTHFELECKAGKGGRLSPGQQKRQKDVNRANGLYYIVHGIEELKHFMEWFII